MPEESGDNTSSPLIPFRVTVSFTGSVNGDVSGAELVEFLNDLFGSMDLKLSDKRAEVGGGKIVSVSFNDPRILFNDSSEVYAKLINKIEEEWHILWDDYIQTALASPNATGIIETAMRRHEKYIETIDFLCDMRDEHEDTGI